MDKKPIRLSKSQYVKGRQCIKKVWLYNYKKEKASPPSAFQEHLFSQGNDVGLLAHKLFPDGENITEDYNQINEALEHTKKAISEGVKVLFEGAFIFNNVLVRADILKSNEDGSWDLLEVKSSSSWKKVHCLDLAVQKYVIESSGLKIRSTSIVHLNKDYVRGDNLDLKGLFKTTTLTEEIELEYQLVPSYLENIQNFLEIDKEPDADIGSVCKTPYPCEFKDYCWSQVAKDSIHYITRITDKKRSTLLAQGCELVNDIPNDFDLSPGQRVQVECAKESRERIESNEIRDFLTTLKPPLFYLDFESIPMAIPPFKGYSPYQHLTFQYSLHIGKEEKGLRHEEFIMDSIAPPGELLGELTKHLGEEGSIVVYNASFERSRLMELRYFYPHFSQKINDIISRLWDLMIPFQKKWYYAPEFYGSYSIKQVLPVFAPELNYKDLEISKGDDAVAGFLKYVEMRPGIEKDKVRENLLEYCKLDTYSMVVILDRLKKKV